MKKFSAIGILSALCLAAFFAGRAQSQDGSKAPAEPEAEAMKAMMKAWQESITPGEGHKVLDHFVGEWDTVMKLWMQGPQAPPMELKGASKLRWVLGGRFVMEEMTGQGLGPDGKGGFGPVPFEGMGLTGYENFNQRYVGCWADSQNTHLLSLTGNYDAAVKTFTFEGEMAEPMLGIKSRKIKYVTRVTGPDSHVFEVFDLAVGPDYKVVEIEYKRKK